MLTQHLSRRSEDDPLVAQPQLRDLEQPHLFAVRLDQRDTGLPIEGLAYLLEAEPGAGQQLDLP
nr:hypothetical protein [Tamaricihabitans halophyticus]